MICEYFKSENYIVVDKAYFDIAYIEQIHSDSLTELNELRDLQADCEEKNFILMMEHRQILTDILTGTIFTIDIVEPTGITTLQSMRKQTSYIYSSLPITQIQSLILTDFKISLKNTLGQIRFQARFERI